MIGNFARPVIDLKDDLSLMAELKKLSYLDVKVDSADIKSPIPIFIVGMPRSGSSLLEQIISGHELISGGGELEEFNLLSHYKGIFKSCDHNNLKSLAESYLSCLKLRSPNARLLTDKMPLNFRYVDLIFKCFTNAKVIHISRDPMATCWSIYKNLFFTYGNGYSNSLQSLSKYYSSYHKLMAHYHSIYGKRILK